MKPGKKNVGHMPQRPTFSGMLWTQCHPWQCQVWTFTVVHTGLSVVIKQKQWTEFFICFFSSVTYLSDQQYICFM